MKTSEAYWKQPLKWDRQAAEQPFICKNCKTRYFCDAGASPRCDWQCEIVPYRPRVFCASLADVFEDWQGPIVDSKGAELWYPPDKRGHCDIVTLDSLRRDLFALIDQTPNLDWLILTKRPENVQRMWPVRTDGSVTAHQPFRKNCWLGTSVSDQATADRNIPMLLERRDLCPVLFLSCEPLLGPVDLTPWLPYFGFGTLQWVIVGGESGSNHRPMELVWAHDLHRQCRDAGVPFFFKQVASRYSGAGVDALGKVVQEFPR